eukprot:gene15010-22910_t
MVASLQQLCSETAAVGCEECWGCGASFSAWKRGHACAVCKEAFCVQCTKERSGLDRVGITSMVRTCLPCAKKEDRLHAEKEGPFSHDFTEDDLWEDDDEEDNETASPDSSSAQDGPEEAEDLSASSECDPKISGAASSPGAAFPTQCISIPSSSFEDDVDLAAKPSSRYSRKMQIIKADCGVTVWTPSATQ